MLWFETTQIHEKILLLGRIYCFILNKKLPTAGVKQQIHVI